MSVRHSLLAILDQGPCYGYQLRSEYERRTGATGLNVGQIYATLERLERDGLVSRNGADERGHVYWAITDAGRSVAADWFGVPDPRESRDDLVHKIALAATLPGVDAGAIAQAQRERARRRADDLARERDALRAAGAEPRELILAAAAHARASADLMWLGAALDAIADAPASAVFGLSDERPRRGRPASAQAG